jgi:hypothetical protein
MHAHRTICHILGRGQKPFSHDSCGLLPFIGGYVPKPIFRQELIRARLQGTLNSSPAKTIAVLGVLVGNEPIAMRLHS